ncbi:MAG: RDD family protein [Acidobacteriota bacterium]|jgi:uncharacterized RDD family membrane protein YckC|nr:RDD family protein [Acidobacteriota bacterium]MDQ3373456.1 RDD family protein [Acidobacteriota bacterium]
MINDSVREELKTKVSCLAKPLNVDKKADSSVTASTVEQAVNVEMQKSVVAKTNTSELVSNPTNPTLIEFHSKNATLPEWRLQLQNTIRQRNERSGSEIGKHPSPPAQSPQLITRGAIALKSHPAENSEQSQTPNPTLASALQRIKDSRQQFLVEEKKEVFSSPSVSSSAPNKNYPFYIAAKTEDTGAKKAQINPSVCISSKPKLATPVKKEAEDLDTNKLPSIPKAAKISTSFEKHPPVSVKEVLKIDRKVEIKNTVIKPDEIIKLPKEPATSNEIIAAEDEIEYYDDCAPIAMRFNAGLFDLIIGLFVSLILLSPFLLWGGNWWSFAGVAGFLATWAVVMFAYLTTAIGYYGKTFGMRLFSLEVIDIEGDNYPTLHQAAVSSSLYILSLAFGGIGFLTLAFNEEKRAAHDLVSRTIVIREE